MSKERYNKLELTWIGKDEEPRLEPRILIENSEFSYGNPKTENMLIHGDNLLALKALEQEYAGKVKCACIDPPYNTGNAFEHYDDGVEHSEWLSLMSPRLKIIRNLLSEEGTIWIAIDDDESHYLKVLCDEIFGRINFVSNVIWQKKFSPQNDAKWFSDMHDHILVYAKNKNVWRPNLLPRTDEMDSRYKNMDNDSRGSWSSSDLTVKTYSAAYDYPITTPSGKVINPPAGRCWRTSKEKMAELIRDNRIWFGENGSNVPRLKRFLTDVKDGITASTIWLHTEVGHNQEARHEVKAFNIENIFATPKPERLIKRILFLASNEGDIVLDSFLGSGTTSAVAHKMRRKWIGIELGEHAKTHCYPRFKAVIDGEQGGISEAVEWKGGGGFKFYSLAPSLLNKDKFGNWIISKEYNPTMLAAAMAKQEGFHYQPDEHYYWKQGKSSEKDYIYTTTQFITVEMLDKIHDEMKEEESVLITCKAFHKSCENKYPNISIKKIPHVLLDRCEFGKEDYSFNIVNMPRDNEEEYIEKEIESSTTEKDQKAEKKEKVKRSKKKDDNDSQLSML